MEVTKKRPRSDQVKSASLAHTQIGICSLKRLNTGREVATPMSECRCGPFRTPVQRSGASEPAVTHGSGQPSGNPVCEI